MQLFCEQLKYVCLAWDRYGQELSQSRGILAGFG